MVSILSMAVFCATLSSAQIGGEDIDPATAMELEYVRLLNEAGMADYAQEVIAKIKHPDAAILVERLKIQALLAVGEFDKVKAMIGAKPDQGSKKVWALKLALADGFYAWGRYAEAQAVYQGFFKTYASGPPASLKRFYLESAYKYAQMLLLMGKEADAAKAYSLAINAIPKNDEAQRHVRRQLMGEKAELLVKLAEEDKANRSTYIKQVEDLLNDLLWYQDIWFGKGIVMMAHIKMMERDVAGAKKLIDEYKAQLKGIDDALEAEYKANPAEDLRHLSPMAECRYLLGAMMQAKAEQMLKAGESKDEAIELLIGKPYKTKDPKTGKVIEKNTPGAFQHLINVFVKYPSTKWAPECGKRAEEIKEKLMELGTTVNYEIPKDKLQKVMEAQFTRAHSLYNQRQFRQAIDAYLEVLNRYPEGEPAANSLGSLASAYIEAQTEMNDMDEMHVDLVLSYLGERFGKNKDLMLKAGDQLLRVATMYEERKLLNRRDAIYDIFFTEFTLHPRSAAMLFMFGNKRFDEKDIAGAMHYYGKITEDYKHTPLYTDALNKMAACHAESGDRIKEITALSTLVTALGKKPSPGYQMANARFRLSTALKNLSSDYQIKSRSETGATAAKYKQLSAKYLVTSLKQFDALLKLLSDKESRRAFYKTADQEEAVGMMMQGSLFYKASCYSMLESKDAAREKAYKQLAIKSLVQLTTDYPKSKFAPAALSQLAALYAAAGNLAETERTIRNLKKEYGESKEAQNAQYMLAKTLLDMGRREAAVREFKKMFEGGGDFSNAKILTAGKELLNAGEFEIAGQAFNQVLPKAQSPSEQQAALLGVGQAMLGLKKYGEAAKALAKFVEKYPRSTNMIEAALGLSEAYSELAAVQQDPEKRRTLFDDAVIALKKMRKYAPAEKAAGLRAKSTLEAGRIQIRKYEAEKKFGTDEEAMKDLGDAVSTFQMMIMTAKLTDKDVRPYIEEAYMEVGPLLLTLMDKEEDREVKEEELKNLLKDCETYFETFVPPRFASQVRKTRTKANAQLMLVKQAPSVPGTGAAPAPGAGAATPPAGGDQAGTTAPPAGG